MMSGPFPSAAGSLSGTVASVDLESIIKGAAAKERMNENDIRDQIKLLELRKQQSTVEGEMWKSLDSAARASADRARQLEAAQKLMASGVDPAALGGGAGRRYRRLFSSFDTPASGPSIRPNLGGFTTADDGGYGGVTASGPSIRPNLGGFTTADDGGYGGVKASAGEFGLGGISSQLSGSTTTGPANWKQRITEIAKSKYTGPVIEAVLGAAVLGLAEGSINMARAGGARGFGLAGAANMSASSNLGSSIQSAEIDKMQAATVRSIPIIGGLADAIMGLSVKAEQSMQFLRGVQGGLADSFSGMYDASSRYAAAKGKPIRSLQIQQKQEYAESTSRVQAAQQRLNAAKSGGDQNEISLARSALTQAQAARYALDKTQTAELAQRAFGILSQAGGLGSSATANRALLAGDTIGAFQANAQSQTFGMMGQMAGQEPAVRAMARANLESSLRVQAFQAAFATPQAAGGVGGISEAMRSAYYMKAAGAMGDQAVAGMNAQLAGGYPGDSQTAVISIQIAVQRIAEALQTGTVRIEHQ